MTAFLQNCQCFTDFLTDGSNFHFLIGGNMSENMGCEIPYPFCFGLDCAFKYKVVSLNMRKFQIRTCKIGFFIVFQQNKPIVDNSWSSEPGRCRNGASVNDKILSRDSERFADDGKNFFLHQSNFPLKGLKPV